MEGEGEGSEGREPPPSDAAQAPQSTPAGDAASSSAAPAAGSRLTKSLLRGHKDSVLCLAAGGAQGERLASGSADGTCRVWDMRSGSRRSVRAALLGSRDVTGVVFHPTQEHLLIAAAGRDVVGFDLRAEAVLLREPAHSVEGIAKEEINQLAVDSSGELVAVADDSGQVHLLNLATWTLERTLEGKRGHDNICSSVASRPGRTWGLASGGMDAAVVLWSRGGKGRVVRMQPDVEEGSATSTGGAQLLNPPFVHSVAYSLDGRSVAAGLGDGTVSVLDADSGAQRERLRGGHAAAVAQVLYTPCGLFSAGNDLQLCHWGRSKVRLEHSEKVNWLAWSSGALVVAGLGNDITVYEGFQ